MNKKNNKGFSLVELIVVIAIMAVLVGVLAPAYLRYVEKSRLQKDISAVGEVVNACEIAMTNETVYKKVKAKAADGQTITLTKSDTTTLAASAEGKELEGEVKLSIPKVTLSSAKLTADVTIKVTVETDGTVKVVVGGGGSDTDWTAAVTELNN